MSNKIYLVTTAGCEACHLQERFIRLALELNDRNDIEVIVCDYEKLPHWIKTNVKFTDFPVTIFVKDYIIKYTIVGTKSVNNITRIMIDIKF